MQQCNSAADTDPVPALCNRCKFTAALSLYRKLVCDFKITEVLTAIGVQSLAKGIVPRPRVQPIVVRQKLQLIIIYIQVNYDIMIIYGKMAERSKACGRVISLDFYMQVLIILY